jgi:DNA-directed RNA polymerase subunit RPC12/RpoP
MILYSIIGIIVLIIIVSMVAVMSLKKNKKKAQAQIGIAQPAMMVQEGTPQFQMQTPSPSASQPLQFAVNGQPQAQDSVGFFVAEGPQDSQTPTFQIEEQAPPASIPMAQPAAKKAGEEFQCPQCSKIFIVALEKRPLHIRCPYCGLEGIID